MQTNTQKKLEIGLFFLRLGIFLVMLFWTLDKFVRVDHAKQVFEHFYFLSSFSDAILFAVGALELGLLLMFVTGYKKKQHNLISTLSSYKQYAHPFESVNLLFFAAWPMLAACFLLYTLRDEDRLLTVGNNQ